MNISSKEIDALPTLAREIFAQWDQYLRDNEPLQPPESRVYDAERRERVLFHAVKLGHEIFGGDRPALTALAQTAVLRQDALGSLGPGVALMPEATLMIQYSDLATMRGKVCIRHQYPGSLPKMFKLYDIFKNALALGSKQ